MYKVSNQLHFFPHIFLGIHVSIHQNGLTLIQLWEWLILQGSAFLFEFVFGGGRIMISRILVSLKKMFFYLKVSLSKQKIKISLKIFFKKYILFF